MRGGAQGGPWPARRCGGRSASGRRKAPRPAARAGGRAFSSASGRVPRRNSRRHPANGSARGRRPARSLLSTSCRPTRRRDGKRTGSAPARRRTPPADRASAQCISSWRSDQATRAGSASSQTQAGSMIAGRQNPASAGESRSLETSRRGVLLNPSSRAAVASRSSTHADGGAAARISRRSRP